MKILKKGKVPADHTHIVTCKMCKTQFSFYRKEGTIVVEGDGDYVRVRCPLCNEIVTDKI